METAGLRQVVDRMVKMDDATFQAFTNRLHVRELRKGEVLWHTNSICREVGFITKGVMRYFFWREDSDVTGQFFFENSFVTIYESLVSGAQSEISFQALEEVTLLMISKDSLQQLFDQYKPWERFGRLMAEHTVAQMVAARNKQVSIGPLEKYLTLVRERPKVLERIPLHFIASYLNMSPEHLSRVRREVAEKGLL